MLFFLIFYIGLFPTKQQAKKNKPLYQKVYKLYFLRQKIVPHTIIAFWVRHFNKFNFPLQAPNGTFHHFAILVKKLGFLSRFRLIIGQIRAGSQHFYH